MFHTLHFIQLWRWITTTNNMAQTRKKGVASQRGGDAESCSRTEPKQATLARESQPIFLLHKCKITVSHVELIRTQGSPYQPAS